MQNEPAPEPLRLHCSLAFGHPHVDCVEGVFFVSAEFWLHPDGRRNDLDFHSSPWACALHNADEGWISLAANRPRDGSKSDHLVLFRDDDVLLSPARTANEIAETYRLNDDRSRGDEDGSVAYDQAYLLDGGQLEYQPAAADRFTGTFESRGRRVSGGRPRRST